MKSHFGRKAVGIGIVTSLALAGGTALAAKGTHLGGKTQYSITQSTSLSGLVGELRSRDAEPTGDRTSEDSSNAADASDIGADGDTVQSGDQSGPDQPEISSSNDDG